MDLDQLLAALLSNDNQVRKPAEEAVKSLSNQAEVVPQLLLRVQHAANPEVRQLAAVLLRKRIAKHWPHLSTEVKKGTQAVLLQCIANESLHMVRRAVADVAAVVAKQTVPKNQWPELLGTMQQWSQGGSGDHREVALTLFTSLAESIGEHMGPALPTLMNIIGAGVADSHSGVRLAALRAAEQLIQLIEQPAHVTAFHELLGHMLQCARGALGAGREEEGLKVFQLLSDACEAPAPLLGPHIPAVVQLSCDTAASRQFELETRDQALQALLMLAINKPKQLTKHKALLKQILATVFRVACEDPPGGHEDEKDATTKTPRALAGQTLDTLALHLPMQHIGPDCLEFARSALGSPAAHDRCGSMTVLAVLCEGGAKWLRKRLDDVLPLVMAGLKDADSNVRAAAAFAVGQMSEFMPVEMLEHHAQVLPAVLAVMANEQDPDLQERACYALDTFCEHLEPQEIHHYMGQIMEQLVRVLAGGAHVAHVGVQEVALSAIASTATAAGPNFAPHVQLLLPALSHFMGATSADLIPCRCRAMEVMGVMMEHLVAPKAETTGASSSTGPGASPLASLVPGVMEVSLAGWQLGHSEIREYSHGLWASMAKGLGAGFSPFLPHVVPLAFNSLEQDEGNLALAGSDDDDDGTTGEASESPEKAPNGRNAGCDEEDIDTDSEEGGAAHQVHVRSGVLDEKCAALQALGLYAEHTGAAFLPHLEASLQWAVRMADEAWHEELQIQAAEAIPRLIKSGVACFPSPQPGQASPQVQAALAASCPCLVGLLSNPDTHVVCAALNAWKELLTQLGGAALGAWLPQVSDMVSAVLRDKAPCCEYLQDEDDEDADADGEGESDAMEDLLAAVCDLLPAMVSAVGADAYAPVFASSHLPALLHRFGASQPEDMRGIAVGALAEVAERMQAHMSPHLSKLVPLLIKELRASDAINRQNAAFAVGVLVEGCEAQASGPFIPQLLQALHPLFNSKEEPGTRDNAVGCVSRMILCAPPETPIVPLDVVVPAVCAALPPGEDWAESGPSYRALCQLLLADGQVTHVITPHVPLMMRTLAAGAASPELPAAVKALIKETVQRLQAKYGQQLMAVLSSLPVELQQALV